MPVILDHYDLNEILGEEGIATVYKAVDIIKKKGVIVKKVHLQSFSKNNILLAQQRFELEINTITQLNHPNILEILDHGFVNDERFLVTPFLEGNTLQSIIKERGRIPWNEALPLLIPVAEALAYAHSVGICHLDINPANIFVTSSGIPKLVNFHTGLLFGDETTLNPSYQFFGTPAYTAPEIVNIKDVNVSSEIYALGVVLYEILIGNTPFQTPNPFKMRLKHITEPLPLPSRFIDPLPSELEQALVKALAKEPADRYFSMENFVNALKKISSQTTQVVEELESLNKNAEEISKPELEEQKYVSSQVIEIPQITEEQVQPGKVQPEDVLQPEAETHEPLIPQSDLASQSAEENVEQNIFRLVERFQPEPEEFNTNLSQQQENSQHSEDLIAPIVREVKEDQKKEFEEPEPILLKPAGTSQFLEELVLPIATKVENGSQLEPEEPKPSLSQPENHLQSTDMLAESVEKQVAEVKQTEPAKITPKLSKLEEIMIPVEKQVSLDIKNIEEADQSELKTVEHSIQKTTDNIQTSLIQPTTTIPKQKIAPAISSVNDIPPVIKHSNKNEKVVKVIPKQKIRIKPMTVIGIEIAFIVILVLIILANGKKTESILPTEVVTIEETALTQVATAPASIPVINSPTYTQTVTSTQKVATTTPNNTPTFETASYPLIEDPLLLQTFAESPTQPFPVISLTFSPDGTTLATSSDSRILLWSTKNWTFIKTFAGQLDEVRSIVFFPDTTIFARGSFGTIIMRDMTTGQRIRTFKDFSDDVDSIAISPDGRLFAGGSEDYTINLYSAANWTKLFTLEGHQQAIYSVAFSPDGKMLASGSGDTTVMLWDVASGQQKQILKGHIEIVRGVTYSPDGNVLASASLDGNIILWDPSTGEILRTLTTNNSPIFAIAFSPDGSLLASASEDQLVTLWDTRTWTPMYTLTDFTSPVLSLAFSNNEKYLACGSKNGSIYVWQLDFKK